MKGAGAAAFVISANIHRRHMIKGQRAMAVAKVRLVSNQTVREAANQAALDRSRVVQASTVLQFAPDLADNVLLGATSLDEAYKTARERKDAASSEEAQLETLRARAPELADKVVEGELSLAGPRRPSRRRVLHWGSETPVSATWA